MNDTIYALASGAGRAAIAVIRISGPRSRETLLNLGRVQPKPRVATYCSLQTPIDQVVLDKAVATYFEAPASFTGEDQLELSLHGGPAVVAGVVQALDQLGLRSAKPGEFTRRAFQNGKLDLTEAEGIADLIDAETTSQRDQALRQLGGGINRRNERWRSWLLEAAAMIEAVIDFSDEDLPLGISIDARIVLNRLESELKNIIKDQRGEQVRSGYRVALIGATNAGKSSLFNALLKHDAAIVTNIPGTTRDIIEASFDLNGIKTIIADMAGLRQTEDTIEQEGVRRARVWASNADLRLLVVDQASTELDWDEGAGLLQPNDVMVLNKQDRHESENGHQANLWAKAQGLTIVGCEAASHHINDVVDILALRVASSVKGGDAPIITRMRHRKLLTEAHYHLTRALISDSPIEIVGEDVRLTLRALECLVGKTDVEAVLGRVFSTFCIGK